jgi:GNAT superfamily N-acetyltransferase
MSDLLALYDHDERYSATYPDTRREESNQSQLVRHVDLVNQSGVVLYSNLTPDTADSTIQQQIAFFQSIGQDFEWKAFAHDQPADLVQRLAAHGFEIDTPEAILVLDLSLPWAFHPTHSVRRLLHPSELSGITHIRQLTYAGDQQQRVDRLAFEMTHAPKSISVYVAYVDNTAAACAWVRFPEKSAFASLWGGTTVPDLRNRGLYTALLHARVHEAQRRHYRYLTVDARPMSRPILEKRGFQLLTHATACTWSAHT